MLMLLMLLLLMLLCGGLIRSLPAVDLLLSARLNGKSRQLLRPAGRGGPELC